MLITLTEDDWELWRRVRLAALADAPEAFHSTLAEESGHTEERWRAVVRPEQGVKVVELNSGGEPVGVAGGFVEDGEAHLFGMWVAAAARGSGVSRRLVAAVLDWAAREGHPAIGLWVVEDNARAVALYARCGFALVEEYLALPRDPSRRYLRMVRPLAPAAAAEHGGAAE